MGFDYTKIKFFIRQKLVTNIPYARTFHEEFYGDISRYVTY